MFARRYFAARFFAPRYFSQSQGEAVSTPAPAMNTYGRHVQATGRRFRVAASGRNWRVIN